VRGTGSSLEIMASDGEAGGSARGQYLRKITARHEQRLKFFGPKLGKFLNAVIPDSDQAKSWEKGFTGETAVGKFLDEFAKFNNYSVLHDRKMPGSRANIDHILISDRGVFVIDAKNYRGLIEVRDTGSLLKIKETLFVAGRNQSKLVEGVKKQVSAVHNQISKSDFEIEVKGILTFVGGDFPIFFKPKEVEGVLINSRGLAETINTQKVLPGFDIDSVSDLLREKFPRKTN
jgi:hypothetical protein